MTMIAVRFLTITFVERKLLLLKISGVPNQTLSNQHVSQQDSREIMPIFQKLLEDKQNGRTLAETSSRSHDSSRASSRFNAARSCPDMSVRCDIIEYL